MLADPEMRALAQEELERLRTARPRRSTRCSWRCCPGTTPTSGPPFSRSVPVRAARRRRSSPPTWRGCTSGWPRRMAGAGRWWRRPRPSSAGTASWWRRSPGKGVFAALKFESGVHRVQRVPATESGGRIHTSAATVAVLPEAEEVDVAIPAQDLRIDTMRASGAGGQHVNTTNSAVRITHLPTGIVVTSSEKSQHQNRARAMEVLRARLYDLERQKRDAERAADRKGQVGSGDRSERIRTYNFPQGRLTDHRIGLTLYKLDQVMQGDLDEVIEALTAADQAARLADARRMTGPVRRCAAGAERGWRPRACPTPARDVRRLMAEALGVEAGRLTLVVADPLPRGGGGGLRADAGRAGAPPAGGADPRPAGVLGAGLRRQWRGPRSSTGDRDADCAGAGGAGAGDASSTSAPAAAFCSSRSWRSGRTRTDSAPTSTRRRWRWRRANAARHGVAGAGGVSGGRLDGRAGRAVRPGRVEPAVHPGGRRRGAVTGSARLGAAPCAYRRADRAGGLCGASPRASPRSLAPGGRALLEVGAGQGAAVASLLRGQALAGRRCIRTLTGGTGSSPAAGVSEPWRVFALVISGRLLISSASIPPRCPNSSV